ncbi:hypothetical protein SCH01S_03_00190 [Sphingomonas changbaiensis NBRC 104936]|uniref:DUF4345 domain-containing protein n=1 Tax=Sphingomonas changbaiensis NBRC 104936 TaxID=1219043 RepID=A0A0E9MLN8_9SPHN|nr:hypothetical protein [Sphingomonas changbaiensis]GAO38045.1 hypothetical protein SCH01S_03_00190 [Sphingomonas changbaiensis NBRC 104936]
MTGLARVAAVLVGLFGLALGIWFFIKTPEAAAAFFVEPLGAAGQATLRADMSSFFLIGAAWAFYAAAKGRGAALLVPAALYAVAITGRAVNLAVNGYFAGAALPMIVEAMLILLCVFGYKALRPQG